MYLRRYELLQNPERGVPALKNILPKLCALMLTLCLIFSCSAFADRQVRLDFSYGEDARELFELGMPITIGFETLASGFRKCWIWIWSMSGS